MMILAKELCHICGQSRDQLGTLIRTAIGLQQATILPEIAKVKITQSPGQTRDNEALLRVCQNDSTFVMNELRERSKIPVSDR
jgi:hypothetical protein